MRVTLLYFAALREQLGKSDEIADIPNGSTVGDLLARLPRTTPVIRIAVNEEFVSISHAVCEGDTVAFIPPIAGGGTLVDVRDIRLDVQEAISSVAGPEYGAVAVFLGVVRNHSDDRNVEGLEYQAYRDMCLRQFAKISQQAEQKFLSRVAILHRVGSLKVGDLAVVVAAAATHRNEAFAACRYAIDTLKELAPIWKKEIGPNGELWLGPSNEITSSD